MPSPYAGLLDQYGRPLKTARRGGGIRAVVDLAQSSIESERHWVKADGLSAASANSPDVRKKCRDRSRYERVNNSYCRGFVGRLAHDNIGTGPRLQLRISGVSEDAIRQTEDRFAGWAADGVVDLAEKYRVLDESTVGDGECFGLQVTNPVVRDPVKLDLRLIETDQCETPDLAWDDATSVSGIRFDAAGNPIEYHFLKQHPGDQAWTGFGMDYDRVSAAYVLHWFTPSRPGEVRGLPEITAALPLFAYLRRYTLAVINTAENAAAISGILETELPPTDYGLTATTADGEPDMQIIPAVRGALMATPAGMKFKGFAAEQPTTVFHDFVRAVLTEIGCVFQAPLSVVTGNDNDSSFSGGRLNLLPYHRKAWIRRARFKTRVADPMFRAWHAEASRIPDYLPAGLPDISLWAWDWQWDGFDSIDVIKEAQADALELANNTLSLSEICARKGTDWKAVLKQRAAELQLMTELGLPPPGPAAPVAARRATVQADVDTVLEADALYSGGR